MMINTILRMITHGFFFLFLLSKVERNGYFSVSACPKDAKEWEASSRRLKCNKTHNYHCAPDHDRSQFYEFCYEMGVLKVEKGKSCLFKRYITSFIIFVITLMFHNLQLCFILIFCSSFLMCFFKSYLDL